MSGLDAAAPASRWRASPVRFGRLVVGLWLFGTGEGLVVRAALGNSPWTVLAQGLALQTGLSIGVATIVVSFLVLLPWIPLHQRPGLGTIMNAVFIGVAIDVTLELTSASGSLAVRTVELIGGIATVAVGSGLYLGARLGPGPRDGLMTGLHRATGRPIGLVRACVEITALAVGAVLGGTVGIGTVAFALLIGPGVALALRVMRVGRVQEL